MLRRFLDLLFKIFYIIVCFKLTSGAALPLVLYAGYLYRFNKLGKLQHNIIRRLAFQGIVKNSM